MWREVRGGAGFLGREAERSCEIGCFSSSGSQRARRMGMLLKAHLDMYKAKK